MEVVIVHSGDEKYVVCEVRGQKNTPRICLVSMPYLYHSDIVEAYKKELEKGERITRVLTFASDSFLITTAGDGRGHPNNQLDQQNAQDLWNVWRIWKAQA